MSTLVAGEPGSGKTTGEMIWYRESLLRRRIARLVIDAHSDLGPAFSKVQIVEGQAKGLMVDNMGDEDRILGYDLSFQMQTEFKEEQTIESLIQAMLIKRGYKDAWDHPDLELGLRAAFHLVLRQGAPLSSLLHALDWPEYGGLLKTADIETFGEYMRFERMTRSERDKRFGPGSRLLGVVNSPYIKHRLNGLFPFVGHLRRGGTFVLNGKNCPSEKFRFWGNLLLKLAIDAAMREGFGLEVWIDEAERGFVTPWMADILEQSRKFDVTVTLVVQTPDFPEEIHDTIIQATERTAVYRSSGERTLRDMAYVMIGYLDRYKVHHWEERIREVRDRIEQYEKTSRTSNKTVGSNKQWDAKQTEGHTLSIGERQLWKTIVERIPVYESGMEQLFWLMQEIATLDTGVRFVRDRYGVRKQRLIPLPDPLYPCMPGLAELKLEQHLQLLKSFNVFRTPRSRAGRMMDAASILSKDGDK